MNLLGKIKFFGKYVGSSILSSVQHWFYISQKLRGDIVSQFHALYYDRLYNTSITGNASGPPIMTWMGVPILKCPFDLWVYQEIIFEIKPDLIIECGTKFGGSAFYLASLCDLLNQGQVVTIDIVEFPHRPSHQRIRYLHGSSVSQEIVDRVKEIARGHQKVLVILDSDHSREHVLKELEIYHHLVSSGSYLIVEDSNINGHPVLPSSGPGPFEAIAAFLNSNTHFNVDHGREKFLMSFNPSGYLKRTRA